jgi:hypothetical protein
MEKLDETADTAEENACKSAEGSAMEFSIDPKTDEEKHHHSACQLEAKGKEGSGISIPPGRFLLFGWIRIGHMGTGLVFHFH